ncbi:methyltransferase domain-containing protein [Patescibacteria group bacterium]|nr:methyltransferase domain-containing protein [Patescibacteria group bacterium]MBU1457371.1 methyltransferase domain-containing protein [Patescibacteria group bacterium]
MKRKNQSTFDYASKYYTSTPEKNLGKGIAIRVKKVLKHVGRGNKILDVGCYDGYFGKQFGCNNNDVTGIDASMVSVKIAQKRGVNAIVGNLEEPLPFKSEAFDCVFAGEIIEHILDTNSFLVEIHRVLKQKGNFIITTPNVASLARRIMLLLGLNPYFETSFNHPSPNAGHVRYYTKNSLKSLLEHHGFDVISFESDILNITEKIGSTWLADLFPTLGRGLIFKCIKR